MKVQSIKEKLLGLESIYKVECSHSSTNTYNFVIYTPYESHTKEYDDLWQEAQDLIISEEWKKRDETNEEWYFHVDLMVE